LRLVVVGVGGIAVVVVVVGVGGIAVVVGVGFGELSFAICTRSSRLRPPTTLSSSSRRGSDGRPHPADECVEKRWSPRMLPGRNSVRVRRVAQNAMR
jgi:hypothetical protein